VNRVNSRNDLGRDDSTIKIVLGIIIIIISLLAVQMPLNNRPISSRVWKPAKWKLFEMFGACESLALAAETLAAWQTSGDDRG